jgi:arylsulfatase
VREELSHITDIPATVLDVAGVAYPEQFERRRITPLAGRSLLPVLRGGTREGHAVLCWSTSGSRAVREGSWKLVAGPNGPWQLFDLSRDRIESHDLAPAHPDRAARMSEIFEAWKKQ